MFYAAKTKILMLFKLLANNQHLLPENVKFTCVCIII